MCNGDLGMYRVMPWALPSIVGGSTNDPAVPASVVESVGAPVVQSMAYRAFSSYNDEGQSIPPWKVDPGITVNIPISWNDKDAVSSVSCDFSLNGTVPLKMYLDKSGVKTLFSLNRSNSNLISNWGYVGSDRLAFTFIYTGETYDDSTGVTQYYQEGIALSSEYYTLTKIKFYDSSGNVIEEVSL